MLGSITIVPIQGIGEVHAGDDVASLILTALAQQQITPVDTDILVVTQKIVSKAEGRLVDPRTVMPSHLAHTIAEQGAKDAHHYEVVLRESRRIVRMERGVLITETHHGLICANAGVDESNVDGGRHLSLLPIDPDASARQICATVQHVTGAKIAVIISDSFGRPWREGQTNIAIGVAGMAPLAYYADQQDSYGYTMHATVLAVADELAGAAELVMGKVTRVPVALIRGYPFTPADGRASELLRAPERDLFR